MQSNQKCCLGTQEQYYEFMKGKRFTVVGLTSQKGKMLNGKTGSHAGVALTPTTRTMLKIDGDDTIYKIHPRNLIPEGYTLKTIHAPYEVMTLAEEQKIDELIMNAQKSEIREKQWKLCFKYVGPQTNYCFICHQFGTACYDYCAYCGADFLRMVHVQTNKMMTCFKRCQGCIEREKDLNLIGKCQNCWKPKFFVVENQNEDVVS